MIWLLFYSILLFYLYIMEELLNRLKQEANLNDEQAVKSIEVVKEFVKEKFPMLSDAVDKIFAAKS